MAMRVLLLLLLLLLRAALALPADPQVSVVESVDGPGPTGQVARTGTLWPPVPMEWMRHDLFLAARIAARIADRGGAHRTELLYAVGNAVWAPDLVAAACAAGVPDAVFPLAAGDGGPQGQGLALWIVANMAGPRAAAAGRLRPFRRRAVPVLLDRLRELPA
eukprot:gene6835-853_t